MTLIARFSVTGFDPATVSGFQDADWFGALIFHKSFTAGLIGSAETVFLASGQEGSRSYVAVERITAATPDGESGEVTVHHGGLESDPDAWFGLVVPHSGTGPFADWSGSARIKHDADGAFFEFDLT